MAEALVKVDTDNVWRGHLRVKAGAKVPSDREYDIWKLCDTGLSVPDAAEFFAITEQTVRTAVRKVERFFVGTVAVDVGMLKSRQHARLEAIIETALSDYHNSGGTVRTTNRKNIPGSNGEDSIAVEETITEKQMTRDPRFLNTAMKAMEEQRKLWPGANAPSSSVSKVEETKGSTINVAMVVENMSPGELAALEKLEDLMQEQDAIDA
jgi:hypothetical protein